MLGCWAVESRPLLAHPLLLRVVGAIVYVSQGARRLLVVHSLPVAMRVA